MILTIQEKHLDKAPGAYSAVLHHKPTSKFKPNFYAKEVGTEWLVYPWEREDAPQFRIIFNQMNF